MKLKKRFLVFALTASLLAVPFAPQAFSAESSAAGKTYTVPEEKVQNGIHYNKVAAPTGERDDRTYELDLSVGGAADSVEYHNANIIIVMDLSDKWYSHHEIWNNYLKSIYDMCDYIANGNTAENLSECWRQDAYAGWESANTHVNFTFIAYNGNGGKNSKGQSTTEPFGSIDDAWTLFQGLSGKQGEGGGLSEKTNFSYQEDPQLNFNWEKYLTQYFSQKDESGKFTSIYRNLLQLALMLPLGNTNDSLLNANVGSDGAVGKIDYSATGLVNGSFEPKNYIGDNCFSYQTNAEAAFQELDRVLAGSKDGDSNQVLYICDRLPSVVNSTDASGAARQEGVYGKVDSNGSTDEAAAARQHNILDATGKAYLKVRENYPETRFVSLGILAFNAEQDNIKQSFIDYISYTAGYKGFSKSLQQGAYQPTEKLTYQDKDTANPIGGESMTAIPQQFINWNESQYDPGFTDNSKAYFLNLSGTGSLPSVQSAKIWEYLHVIGKELGGGAESFPYAKDAVLTDTIPAEYNLVAGSLTPYCIVTNEDGTETEVPVKDAVPETRKNSDGTTTITWKIGNMAAENGMFHLKYRIQAKDSYFGGEIRRTNTSAQLNYKNHKDEPQGEIVFQQPEVYVPWKATASGGQIRVFYGSRLDVRQDEKSTQEHGEYYTGSFYNTNPVMNTQQKAYSYQLFDANAVTGGSIKNFLFTWLNEKGEVLSQNRGSPADFGYTPPQDAHYTLVITNGTLDDGSSYYPEKYAAYNQTAFEQRAELAVGVDYGSLTFLKKVNSPPNPPAACVGRTFPVKTSGSMSFDMLLKENVLQTAGGLKIGSYRVEEAAPDDFKFQSMQVYVGRYDTLESLYQAIGSGEKPIYDSQTAQAVGYQFVMGYENPSAGNSHPNYTVVITNNLENTDYFRQHGEITNEFVTARLNGDGSWPKGEGGTP